MNSISSFCNSIWSCCWECCSGKYDSARSKINHAIHPDYEAAQNSQLDENSNTSNKPAPFFDIDLTEHSPESEL